jgi:propanol-preferring alcohol dehydrogenase
MKAIQYQVAGAGPVLAHLDDPVPGPGEVLLQVTAAGLCHSDESIMARPAGLLTFPLPITLGLVGGGRVVAVGDGVSGVEIGGSFLVYGAWGCGTCRPCSQGFENYCHRARELGIRPPGLGAPGALAEYLIVDSPRHLVPLGDLDPISAVPLTDAGLTPYHAIKRSMDRLTPGSTTVVIGAGGLGHLGIQLLRALTGTRIIALDRGEAKLELAREVGAHHVLTSDDDAAAAIRELTDGRGAEVVLDFVGAAPTAQLATQVVATDGQVTLVGIGGGFAKVGLGSTPFGASVGTTYWGSRAELAELVELMRSGVLDVRTETFTLEEGPMAYERLHRGEITGRAVVLPGS